MGQGRVVPIVPKCEPRRWQTGADLCPCSRQQRAPGSMPGARSPALDFSGLVRAARGRSSGLRQLHTGGGKAAARAVANEPRRGRCWRRRARRPGVGGTVGFPPPGTRARQRASAGEVPRCWPDAPAKEREGAALVRPCYLIPIAAAWLRRAWVPVHRSGRREPERLRPSVRPASATECRCLGK